MEKNENNKKVKNKSIIKHLLKKNKIFILVLLVMFLLANTYAWFIYNKIVSSDITGHVKAWDLSLEGAEEDNLTFEIGEMYPGMPTYEQKFTLVNNGDVSASISLGINSLQILGDTYIPDNNVPGETSQDYISKLQNDYPFIVTFTTSGNSVTSGSSVDITFRVEWPFESTRQNTGMTPEELDEWDTEWGEKAYEFQQSPLYNGSNSIVLVLGIQSTQVN